MKPKTEGNEEESGAADGHDAAGNKVEVNEEAIMPGFWGSGTRQGM